MGYRSDIQVLMRGKAENVRRLVKFIEERADEGGNTGCELVKDAMNSEQYLFSDATIGMVSEGSIRGSESDDIDSRMYNLADLAAEYEVAFAYGRLGETPGDSEFIDNSMGTTSYYQYKLDKPFTFEVDKGEVAIARS